MTDASTSDTDRSPAFSTAYECRNCGNEWDESHPSKTVVEKSTGIGGVAVKNKDCDELITADCGCCWIVTCPVCELRDDVKVSDRNPIEDGGSR